MSIFNEYREQVHKKIYESSIALFISQGYEKTTISEITKTVGVAKGTFYNFYQSKLEVLFDWAQNVFSQTDFEKAMIPGKTIEQNLHSFIDLITDAMDASHGLFHTFLSELLKQQETADLSAKFDFIKIYEGILKNSSDGENVLSKDPETKVEMLNSVLFMGIINWFNTNNQNTDLAFHLKKMAALLLNGIQQ